MKTDNELMIYVHIPFCVRKCDYCDFVSFVTDEDVKSRYFDAIKKQIKLKAELTGKHPVSSVFLGGGTPSLVNEKYIYEIMNEIRKYFELTPDCEISMEANPNSIRSEALKVYGEAGINRISIGLQSTDNKELKVLSRVHTYEDFLRAYTRVRDAGFVNVNIDLMSAIPGQTPSKWLSGLERVAELNPEHISAYSLIVEENTPFYSKYSGGEELPTEEEDRQIYHETKELLLNYGYNRYEISNYSKPGRECRHNTGYWKRRSYLGMGIAAASLFEEVRYQMHSDLRRFIEGDFSEEQEVLDIDDAMEEFMFLGLRMCEGVDINAFYECFGRDIHTVYGREIEKLKREGLLEICNNHIYLNDMGLDVANYCMAEFIRG